MKIPLGHGVTTNKIHTPRCFTVGTVGVFALILYHLLLLLGERPGPGERMPNMRHGIQSRSLGWVWVGSQVKSSQSVCWDGQYLPGSCLRVRDAAE